MSDVRLARNWTRLRVLESLDNAEKEELIRFLAERYRERFFEPIRLLRQAPGNAQGFGFAIMSLCCLLVETLECYRKGLPSSHHRELTELEKHGTNHGAPTEYKLNGPFNYIDYNSGKSFEHFFEEAPHERFFPNVNSRDFYKLIRCGLLHQAQTSSGWRIIQNGKFWDESKQTINRDEFAERLEDCFDSYLKELSAADYRKDPIWESARKKIWWLAQVS
jgi:hypothetical protein